MENDDFEKRIKKKTLRKLKARKQKDRDLWFGLGAFGVVGWSVSIPTVIGVALGVWLDSKRDGSYSWTLMLLFAGLIVGCLNAWFWVSQWGSDEDEEEEL